MNEGTDPFDGFRQQLDSALAEIQDHKEREQRLIAAIGEDAITEQRLKEENASLRRQRLVETAGHRAIIAVLDNVERMMGAINKDYGGSWIQKGAQGVYDDFRAALSKLGIERIDCEPGHLFDPGVHEALISGPGERGVVTHVLRGGYRYSDGNVIQAVGVGVGDGT
jgi:molecular chaperone GrpE (heat shock protein)